MARRSRDGCGQTVHSHSINADDTDLLGANGDVASLNLFAYCGNNPVIREDDGGQFWHVVAGAVIGGLFKLGSQLLSGEKVNWAKVGVATISGGATALAGPAAGALISGATNVALDAMSGERDIKKLVASGVSGVCASLASYGAGKVVEKVGGKIGTKMLSKMTATKRKAAVIKVKPTIKGSERNAIKTMSYLTSNHPDVSLKYFNSTQIGKTIDVSFEPGVEGFIGIGLNSIEDRWLLSK